MRSRRWLFLWSLVYALFQVAKCEALESPEISEPLNQNNGNANSKDLRGLFSPHMDYEQWTPLGRGDPLKNDPTYDYVPPVLDRVHYWVEPASRKPDASLAAESQKTEILLLGVTSNKPSTGTSMPDNKRDVADSRRDNYDPFLKFVEGPKFTNNYQRISRPTFTIPTSFFPSQLFTKSKLSTIEQHVPYTMLMPPPPPPSNRPSAAEFFEQAVMKSTTSTSPVTKTAVTTATPPVIIQTSHLVYQSSSFGNDWTNDQNYAAPSSQITWKTPTPIPEKFNKTSNLEVKVRPLDSFVKNQQILLTESNSDKTLKNGKSKQNMTFEDSLPVNNEKNFSRVMYKGQVTDDDLDIASTYVSIGKPEAQVHSPTGMEISSASIEPPKMSMRQPPILMTPHPNMLQMMPHHSYRHPPMMLIKPQAAPVTLQTLQTMQTMQPPIVSKPDETIIVKATGLQRLLQKEVTNPVSISTSTLSPSTATISRMPILPTTLPPTTTSAASLTTDPLFKHYKQPSEPLKGPMYLIIQGHSKVKTYGPSKQIHGISVQETNEIATSEDKDEYSVKHLHGFKKEVENRSREGRSGNLQTLSHVVQTGLGVIDFLETDENRRNDEDIKETELMFRYHVSEQLNGTTERYYKGIVEAGEIGRKMKDSFE